MADKAKSGGRPDIATILGIVVAMGGIVGGLLMEGGKVSDIAQHTAAIIVIGGTIGAVLISTPMPVCISAAKSLIGVFLEKTQPLDTVIEQLIDYANKARKNGIVALEQDANAVQDHFLRKGLNLAVDGTDLQEIRKMLELEMALEEHHAESQAKVFEAAGGYAPTIGIIGAVLGLIQVMKDLADIEKVGHGIAVSFVATVYGVGIANIFFLPVANKIKARAQQAMQAKEMMLEGIIGIVEGLNPKLIRAKLEAFAPPKKAGAARPGA